MALKPVDLLLGGYVVFATTVVVGMGIAGSGTGIAILAAHALFVLMLAAFAKLDTRSRVGPLLHDLYPLAMLLPLYAIIGAVNETRGLSEILGNDAVVQRWEAALFGRQVSYEWIRSAPSVFWSGLLHLAYLMYFPVVVAGPVLLVMRGRRVEARSVVFATMLAFVACYMVFLIFPVAGPNYAFAHPTGPVREVWSARLVYRVLGEGSSVGAAFPSSHVAAAVAATLASWRAWPAVGRSLALPAALMTVATVYCQMHYAVDALAGLVLGTIAAWTAAILYSSRGADAGRL